MNMIDQTPAETNTKTLTVREAADRAGCSADAITAHVSLGDLRATADGRIEERSLNQWVSVLAARTKVRDELPPVQCKPWCTAQNGHSPDIDSGVWSTEDQWCLSQDWRVNLSLAEPVHLDDTRTRPDSVNAYVQQRPGEPATIVVNHEDDDFFTLTIAEARSLMLGLQALVDLAS